jgi:hypothetical protein
MVFLIQLVIYFFISTSNAENFCVNCKHFKSSLLSSQLFGKCSVFQREPSNKINYLISGKPSRDYFYCSSVRIDEDKCGTTGKYYEEKKNLFLNTTKCDKYNKFFPF